MHEVAVSTSIAYIFFILPASCLTKIRYRGEVSNDWPPFIRSSNKILQRILCLVFLPKLDVDITNHVVSQIITYVEALDVTIFAQFLKQIFVEILKMGLDLLRIDGLALGVDAGGDHIGALVHVGKQEGGADAGLSVQTRAPVAVPARADLEVKRAVHPVLLRPEYRR